MRLPVRRSRSLLAMSWLSFATLVLMGDEKVNTATQPVQKDVSQHEHFLQIANSSDAEVVFFGDSITQLWTSTGRDSWKVQSERFKCVNFAVSGDRTEHLLWRIQHGELDVLKPKVAVVLIGTNNLGTNTEAEIVKGVEAVVQAIRLKRPGTRVLLLEIFPRGEQATDPVRALIKTINKSLAKLAGKNVSYLDLGDKFLEADGSISKEIMYDFLHLSARGYEIWAEAIQKPIQALMKT